MFLGRVELAVAMIQVFRAMSLISSKRTARMYNSILITWRVAVNEKCGPQGRGCLITQRSTARCPPIMAPAILKNL